MVTPGGRSAAKTALRDQLLAARRRRPPAEAADDAASIARHLLDAPEVRRAATVAAYVGVGPEPGTGLLLDALVAAGTRVLLPVVLPDLDLDWGVYTGSADLVTARMGLLEPGSPTLGVDAVATADAVIVPGLACSADGMRLGRGGGCYDRALARVAPGTFTCLVVYGDEVDRAVPSEPHDQRVAAAVSPAGVVRFRGSGVETGA